MTLRDTLLKNKEKKFSRAKKEKYDSSNDWAAIDSLDGATDNGRSTSEEDGNRDRDDRQNRKLEFNVILPVNTV